MSNLALFAAGVAPPLFSMGRLDLVIIGIYFVVVLGIGFYLKKYASTGEDFFMAGRKMTAWVAGLSFISANLSSLETMGWSAMSYQYGMLGAHAYLIGAIPAILFLAVVMMPFYYICKTHSVPGYLKLRYGEASRTLAGVSFAFMTVLVCGVNMFAMAKVMETMLGWDINFSIWVSSVTVAVYVSLGGLLSAIFNEVLQFFLIWLGTLLVPILGLIEAGGWSKMMATINETHPGKNYTHLWANLGSAADNPMGMHWFGMVFGLGLAVSFGYWCTDFLQVQRVMAAKNLRAAQNGTIIGAVLKMAVPLIVTVPGLLGLVILNKFQLVPESEAAPGEYTTNQVLPLLMRHYLGPGLLGLGVTSMIAGFMSGMAGNVSAFATVWTYDVYRAVLNKNASDDHYVAMGRWCSIIGVFLAIGTAYMAMAFSNILAYLQVLVVFFIVPLFGVVILGMLWKRASPAGGFWGFLSGIVAAVMMFALVHWSAGGFPMVAGRDVKDLPALAAQVKAGADPVSVDLRALLPPDDRTLLDAFNPADKPTSDRIHAVLVRSMNKLITSPTSVVFNGRAEGEAPVALSLADPKGEAAIRRNREALHTAYGVAIGPMHRFDASRLDPEHASWIATSRYAQDMAVSMFSGFWSLMTTLVVTVVVSLFTTPKPESELKDLVYGLTPLPDEGPCPWYEKPLFWAGVVGAVLVGINVYFW